MPMTGLMAGIYRRRGAEHGGGVLHLKAGGTRFCTDMSFLAIERS